MYVEQNTILIPDSTIHYFLNVYTIDILCLYTENIVIMHCNKQEDNNVI